MLSVNTAVTNILLYILCCYYQLPHTVPKILTCLGTILPKIHFRHPYLKIVLGGNERQLQFVSVCHNMRGSD